MDVLATADEHGGVSLISTNANSKGANILDIPISQCITTIQRDGSFDGFTRDPVIKNMVNVQLALNLLFEVFEGKKSKYFHYLKTLPAKPSTVLSLDYETIEPLKGSR